MSAYPSVEKEKLRLDIHESRVHPKIPLDRKCPGKIIGNVQIPDIDVKAGFTGVGEGLRLPL